MGVTAFKVYDKNGQEQAVPVESEYGLEVPRELGAVTKIQEAARSLSEALKPVSAVAHTVLTTLSASVPGKITVEFGVELGGKMTTWLSGNFG